ncbi:MAG: outer membrane beta-barrel protein [Janthinobacterium lividum]
MLTKRLSLVPELQYSRERLLLTQRNVSMGDVLFTDAYHTRLDYLNVPVLSRLTLGKLYLEAGFQASLLLGGQQTGTQTTSIWGMGYQTYIKGIDRNFSNDYRRVDAGACLGVGLQLPTGLGLGLRAYQSLLPLARDPATTHGDLHRQAWQFSLTYQVLKHS